MIYYADQVQYGRGMQEITFYTPDTPSTAEVLWAEKIKISAKEKEAGIDDHVPRSATFDLTPVDDGGYQLAGLIPATEFNIILDTDPRHLHFTGEWTDASSGEYADLEIDPNSPFTTVYLVPYCDLSKLDIQLYDINMDTLQSWSEWSKKIWSAGPADVYDAYGGSTLCYPITLNSAIVVRRTAGSEWEPLSFDDGVYLTVDKLTSNLTHPIGRISIARDSLYKKRYRRTIS